MTNQAVVTAAIARRTPQEDKMIELRWYRFDSYDGLPEWEENPRVITQLQWRRREGPYGEDWWGEWQPIPLVDESTAAEDKRDE